MFSCVLFLFSCEEEPVEMLPTEIPPGDKKILIEDFTGVSCPNCPEGARLIENLKATFPDRIVSLAVYTDGFDDREPESLYDFKIEEGQMMQDYIGTLIGKPSAGINRIFNPVDMNRFFLIPSTWTTPVQNGLNANSEVNLTLVANYDSDSRIVTGGISVIPVVDIDIQVSYTIVIAESHIIDPQIDGQEVIYDYEHNHVLRDVITAPAGEVLSSSLTRGEIVNQPYSYQLPEEDGWWVAENCEIIAFVHLSQGSERRVLQVEKMDLIN